MAKVPPLLWVIVGGLLLLHHHHPVLVQSAQLCSKQTVLTSQFITKHVAHQKTFLKVYNNWLTLSLSITDSTGSMTTISSDDAISESKVTSLNVADIQDVINSKIMEAFTEVLVPFYKRQSDFEAKAEVALAEVLAPFYKRQSDIEAKNDARLDTIQLKLGLFLEHLTQGNPSPHPQLDPGSPEQLSHLPPHHQHHENLSHHTNPEVPAKHHPGLQTQHPVTDPQNGLESVPSHSNPNYIPDAEKPLPPSALAVIPPEVKYCIDPVIQLASRTLGFWPIYLSENMREPNDSTYPPTPESLLQSLTIFLRERLSIPGIVVNKMKYSKLFCEENNPNTMFVEFSSDREVNTVFKYTTSLSKGSRVTRYIHPSLKDLNRSLSERAHQLRNSTEKYQTKILYDMDRLALFIKKPEETCWNQDQNAAPNIHPFSSANQTHVIPQLDGVDDPINLDINSPSILNTSEATSSFQQAPYYLNKEKQTAKLCRDAAISDIDINVNNNNTNVNVQCSAGFYIVVAKPCLTAFTKDSVNQYSSIQVTCSEVFLSKDQAGITDFTRLSFKLRNSDLADLGVVCVHFRHTTRLIQVQGSTKMPDKSTAAVWFTENVLSDRLRQLAKAKAFPIKAFNEGILQMARTHHNSVKSGKFCCHCDKLFSAQSKPSPCHSCKQHVHRTCTRPHLISCSTSTSLPSKRCSFQTQGYSEEKR